MSLYSKFADVYPLIFPFREGVFQFLKSRLLSGEGSVLDVGCGPGHYTARFAREGYQVLGIDLDAGMIRVARQRHAEGSFRVLDMLDIGEIKGSFDLIFCIGNTLAHLPGKDFERFVEVVFNKLDLGGVWIFQVRNWDHVLRLERYDFPILEGVEGLRFYRRYSDITEKSVLFDSRLTIDDQTVFEERVSLYPIKSAQYEAIHEESGFFLQGHFADFDGTPSLAKKDSGNVFVYAK